MPSTKLSSPRQPASATDPRFVALLQRSLFSKTALMRGDIETCRSIVTFSHDFTLMSPIGGTPSRGRDMTTETWQAMGRALRNGAFAQDVGQV